MRACVVDASRSDADQSHPSKVAIRESSGGSRFWPWPRRRRGRSIRRAVA